MKRRQRSAVIPSGIRRATKRVSCAARFVGMNCAQVPRMELNVFWPVDLSYKSGLVYGWVEQSFWVVCAVGPLRDLEQELVILGSLNHDAAKSSDQWVDLITAGGIPQIKHNFTGKNIQIVLYHRPQSYLQFLSMDELNLDLFLKTKIPPIQCQENVCAHIKYPDLNSRINLGKVLELVIIYALNNRSIEANRQKRIYFLVFFLSQYSS
jgi:hypothetical protein